MLLSGWLPVYFYLTESGATITLRPIYNVGAYDAYADNNRL